MDEFEANRQFESLAKLDSSLVKFADREAALLQAAVRPFTQMQAVVADLNRLERQFAELLRPALEQFTDQAAAFERSWNAALPLNWRGMSASQVLEAVDFMTTSGWCLAWIPNQETVQAIVDAGDPASVLLQTAVTIREDLRNCLLGVEEPGLVDHVVAISEAIEAQESGFFLAAQALAAATLTAVVQGYLQYPYLKDVRIDWESREPDGVPLSGFRPAVVLLTLSRAFGSSYPSDEDSANEFNRHATSHTVSPLQYTRINSIVGLMGVVALLRELQQLESGRVRTISAP